MLIRLPILDTEVCRIMAQSIENDANDILKKSPLALNVEIGFVFSNTMEYRKPGALRNA